MLDVLEELLRVVDDEGEALERRREAGSRWLRLAREGASDPAVARHAEEHRGRVLATSVRYWRSRSDLDAPRPRT